MKTEIRWAIYGLDGLYVGQHLTRAAMMAQHVSDKCFASDGFSRISEFSDGRKLNKEQRIAWNKCRKLGDRCVQVEIHELGRTK